MARVDEIDVISQFLNHSFVGTYQSVLWIF